MNVKKVLTSILIAALFLSFPTQAYTQEYYVESYGTYTDETISTLQFIQLMTSWFDLGKLKIFESGDMSREEEEDWTVVEDTTVEGERCAEASDCTGHIIAKSPEGQERQFTPVCKGTQEEKLEFAGRCEVDFSLSIGGNIQGTDFSEESIAIPKLQDSLSRYSQEVSAPSREILEYGTEQLLISSIEQFRQRVIYVKKAFQTYGTVNETGEFPLGGVDYKQKIVCGGSTVDLLVLRENIPTKIRRFDPGWQELYEKALLEEPNWFKQLSCVNPYRNIAEPAYLRTSIVLGGNKLTIQQDKSTGIYPDYRTLGTLDAALNEARRKLPKKQYQEFEKNLITTYPILPYLYNTSADATPTRLISSKNQIFTDEGLFGRVLDNTSTRGNITYNTFNIIGNRDTETAGAVQNSDSSLLDTIVTKLTSFLLEALNAREHAITIPGPAGQILEELQDYTYLTSVPSKENSTTNMNRLSNSLVTSENSKLVAGSRTIPGYSKNTFSRYMACNSKSFSDFGSSVEDYARGQREACNPIDTSSGVCDGVAMGKILSNGPYPSLSQKGESASEENFESLTTDVIRAYSAAELKTGVPCEVLAGIHYREGSNNPSSDLQSGAPLDGRTLTDSAIAAAEELKIKAIYSGFSGNNFSEITPQQLIGALAGYNGWGNSNCTENWDCPVAPSSGRCGETVACATDPSACVCVEREPSSCRQQCSNMSTDFPYTIPYSQCPASFPGNDHNYAVNMLSSPTHDEMYILYQYDCTQTRPILDPRPGAFTFAVSLYNNN